MKGSVGSTSGVKTSTVHPDATKLLLGYPWPGNVRELENVIERLVAMEPSHLITVSGLPPSVLGHEGAAASAGDALTLPEGGLDLEAHLDAVRREIMRQALERCGGVQKDAARLLHLTYRAFRYHAEKYNLLQED